MKKSATDIAETQLKKQVQAITKSLKSADNPIVSRVVVSTRLRSDDVDGWIYSPGLLLPVSTDTLKCLYAQAQTNEEGNMLSLQ